MFITSPPDHHELLVRELNAADPGQFVQIFQRSQEIGVAPGGRYRHWHTLRLLEPPAGLTHEQWWIAIKLARSPLLRKFPLTDKEGTPFLYSTPDEALKLLQYIDQHSSGEIRMPEVVIGDESTQKQYLVNSLMEEAIRSSQLEGATTSRRAAKEMIRTSRAPKDRSERMILNNYNALQYMREIGNKPLTPPIVLELHRILTEGTLDNPDAAGRLQTVDDERVAVFDRVKPDQVIHYPPDANELPGRFQAMCDFANETESTTGFLHPVVRAILLHFWLGHDHPFEDGNGRTARALFYWSMRRSGYWLTDYLSISEIFRKAPARYGRAFVYSETDGNDATYFVLYHLGAIKQAIERSHRYLQRKAAEIRKLEKMIRTSDRFNHRQLALLGSAIRNPDQQYTFYSHARSHNVTFQTARTDLLALEEQGYLEKRKRGKQYFFYPVEQLEVKLAS